MIAPGPPRSLCVPEHDESAAEGLLRDTVRDISRNSHSYVLGRGLPTHNCSVNSFIQSRNHFTHSFPVQVVPRTISILPSPLLLRRPSTRSSNLFLGAQFATFQPILNPLVDVLFVHSCQGRGRPAPVSTGGSHITTNAT